MAAEKIQLTTNPYHIVERVSRDLTSEKCMNSKFHGCKSSHAYDIKYDWIFTPMKF